MRKFLAFSARDRRRRGGDGAPRGAALLALGCACAPCSADMRPRSRASRIAHRAALRASRTRESRLRQGPHRAGTCLECHDADKAKGDLVLEGYDPAKADQRADISEKDRPQAPRRDDAAGGQGAAARGGPRQRSRPRSRRSWTPPPRRARIPAAASFQRLNRAEYARLDSRHAVARRRRHARSCRPTPSATTSTTSPTCSRCRRRCSRATCAPPRR